jgi:hypothetical protein
MELRAQEDEREKQSQYANAPSVLLHVINKMELREEWLRGQVLRLRQRLMLLLVETRRLPWIAFSFGTNSRQLKVDRSRNPTPLPPPPVFL